MDIPVHRFRSRRSRFDSLAAELNPGHRAAHGVENLVVGVGERRQDGTLSAGNPSGDAHSGKDRVRLSRSREQVHRRRYLWDGIVGAGLHSQGRWSRAAAAARVAERDPAEVAFATQFEETEVEVERDEVAIAQSR